MTERTAGSLTQTDTYMGRTVTATGVMTGLYNVGRDVVVELRVRADEVVRVAKR